ncbi:2-dehydro-3-deoxygalactonokinase [Agaribacterium haliotis]|uniref:2-dehydro-3-deoxygalactonokinase n=1 Tax=Agaribacterium haliotis TaxID=2013869 RepID=UPI000BB551C9|nr:2-dehydro-3-deoxygalactonokinase [Agaribacterium haliotis]
MQDAAVNSLIVDWGTTNFRAFQLDSDANVLGVIERPLGLLQVEQGAFAHALENVLSDFLPDYQSIPVFMAGMVGSAKGWVNVAYVPTAASLADLARGACEFILPWGAKATIVPGVSCEVQSAVFDVMRGEEIQIFGLANLVGKSEFNAMFPGTHNKHVHVVDNKIQSFASYLSGEMFAVVSENMLLGKDLHLDELGKHNGAFLRGVDDGFASSALSNTLFRTWTQRLFNHLDELNAADYLSGVLIGNELKQAVAAHYYLVGGASLCNRYELACSHLGIHSTTISGNDCFLAGMAQLIQEKQNG